MWKVTGIIKGGPCDGNKYTIVNGFQLWSSADMFRKRYLKKQGRRYHKLKAEEYDPDHAPLSGGDLVATECPKCGASLIDMDWDLLKVDGGALLCDGCNYAFTEPPKPSGRGA